MTNTDFVTSLYQGLLNREPDQLGLEHHVSALNNNQRTAADLVRIFVGSPEFQGLAK